MSINEHIKWCKYGYYISINAVHDIHISRNIGLPMEEYKKILMDHGAKSIYGESYFPDRISCVQCLEVLEPYIIMAKLEKKD